MPLLLSLGMPRSYGTSTGRSSRPLCTTMRAWCSTSADSPRSHTSCPCPATGGSRVCDRERNCGRDRDRDRDRDKVECRQYGRRERGRGCGLGGVSSVPPPTPIRASTTFPGPCRWTGRVQAGCSGITWPGRGGAWGAVHARLTCQELELSQGTS
jgi:hypothetical protein